MLTVPIVLSLLEAVEGPECQEEYTALGLKLFLSGLGPLSMLP